MAKCKPKKFFCWCIIVRQYDAQAKYYIHESFIFILFSFISLSIKNYNSLDLQGGEKKCQLLHHYSMMVLPHLLSRNKNKQECATKKLVTQGQRALGEKKRSVFSSYNRKKSTLVDVFGRRSPSHSPLTPYYVK